MADGMALISSEILCLRLCSLSLPHVSESPQKETTIREIGRTGWPRNVAIAWDYAMFKHRS